MKAPIRHKIRIRETRTVTLEVMVDAAKVPRKEKILALVEKQKGRLALRDLFVPETDMGQPIFDDAGHVIGTFGEVKEEERKVELLRY